MSRSAGHIRPRRGGCGTRRGLRGATPGHAGAEAGEGQRGRAPGGGGGLDEALDSGADYALAASLDALAGELGREPTEDEATRVRAVLRSALAEVLTAERWQQASAAVYARHLAPAELEDLAAFFRSPTGTKLLGLQSEISGDLGDGAEEILGERGDEFARLVDEGLAEEFPELEPETEE